MVSCIRYKVLIMKIRPPLKQISILFSISIVLRNLGFQKGDTMHIVATNDISFFPLVLAIWKLGGISSYGDPALDSETIKYQVCAMHVFTFIEVFCSVKYAKNISISTQILQTKSKFVACCSMTGPNVKEAIEDLDNIDLISLGKVDGAEINIKELGFHQNICEAGMTWYPTNYLICPRK